MRIVNLPGLLVLLALCPLGTSNVQFLEWYSAASTLGFQRTWLPRPFGKDHKCSNTRFCRQNQLHPECTRSTPWVPKNPLSNRAEIFLGVLGFAEHHHVQKSCRVLQKLPGLP